MYRVRKVSISASLMVFLQAVCLQPGIGGPGKISRVQEHHLHPPDYASAQGGMRTWKKSRMFCSCFLEVPVTERYQAKDKAPLG